MAYPSSRLPASTAEAFHAVANFYSERAAHPWSPPRHGDPPGYRLPARGLAGDNLVGLAEGMAPLVADDHLRASVDSAGPDDVYVDKLRRKLEGNRRNRGDEGYAYPAHLIGPAAAACPPPGWIPEDEAASAEAGE
ncbi:MAG: hypothetical protein V7603_5161 [Micromonosporaceae bacterium]